MANPNDENKPVEELDAPESGVEPSDVEPEEELFKPVGEPTVTGMMGSLSPEGEGEGDAPDKSDEGKPDESEGKPEDKPGETDEGSEEEPPKGKTAADRIKRLTWERHQAERKAAQAEKAAEFYKAQARKQALESEAKPRPDPENFETRAEYEDALETWQHVKRQREEIDGQIETYRKELVGGFQKAAADFKKDHPDFDKLTAAEIYDNPTKEAIMGVDNGPEIAYFLAQPENFDYAMEISQMPPARQAVEVGRISAQLASLENMNKTSNAPEPIEPVGNRGTPKKKLEDMSMDEFMAHEEAERLARIKREMGP